MRSSCLVICRLAMSFYCNWTDAKTIAPRMNTNRQSRFLVELVLWVVGQCSIRVRSWPRLSVASDHDSIEAKDSLDWGEGRNRFGLDEWRAIAPEALRVPLLSGAVVVKKIGPIARGVVAIPLIRAGDADLMVHIEPVPGSLLFILQELRQE